MAALRFMLEKVGKMGFSNHLVRRTSQLGFLGAVNPTVINNNHHLLSRHSSFRCCYTTADGARGVLNSLFSPERLEEDEEQLKHILAYNLDLIPSGSLLKFGQSLDSPRITEPAIAAVKQYNHQQNTNLEFVRVVKAYTQAICGRIYHITLEAIDHNGAKNTYQAKIWRNIGNKNALELQSFSLTPNNQTNLIDKQGAAASHCHKHRRRPSASPQAAAHRLLFRR